jgi:hypothetical protein
MKKLLLLGLLCIPAADMYAGKKKGKKPQTLEVVPLTAEAAATRGQALFAETYKLNLQKKKASHKQFFPEIVQDAHRIDQQYRIDNGIGLKAPSLSRQHQYAIKKLTKEWATEQLETADKQRTEALKRYLYTISKELVDLNRQIAEQEATKILKALDEFLDLEEKKIERTERKSHAAAQALEKQQQIEATKAKQQKKKSAAKARELALFEAKVKEGTAGQEEEIIHVTPKEVYQSIAGNAQVLYSVAEAVKRLNKEEYGQTNHKVSTTIQITETQVMDVEIILSGFQEERLVHETTSGLTALIKELEKLRPGCKVTKIYEIIREVRSKHSHATSNGRPYSLFHTLGGFNEYIKRAFTQDPSCTTADTTTLKITKGLAHAYIAGAKSIFGFQFIKGTLSKIGSRPNTEEEVVPSKPKKRQQATTTYDPVTQALLARQKAAEEAKIEGLRKKAEAAEQALQATRATRQTVEGLIEGLQVTKEVECEPDNFLTVIEDSFTKLQRIANSNESTSTKICFCPVHAFRGEHLCSIATAPPMDSKKIEQTQALIDKLIVWTTIQKLEIEKLPDIYVIAPNLAIAEDPEIKLLFNAIQEGLNFYIYATLENETPPNKVAMVKTLKIYRDHIVSRGWKHL